jgi:hypothetical protein
MTPRGPALLLAATLAALPTAAQSPPSWLAGAPDDKARWERLEFVLRGSDVPMWEVGERWARLHDALQHDNRELARYHWEKIRWIVEGMALKRPRRAENARRFLLDGETWKQIDQGLADPDRKAAWAAFERGRALCMGCHVAEQMPFMNSQAVLRDLRAPVVAR